MKRFYEKLIRKFMTSFETFFEQFHKTITVMTIVKHFSYVTFSAHLPTVEIDFESNVIFNLCNTCIKTHNGYITTMLVMCYRNLCKYFISHIGMCVVLQLVVYKPSY